MLFQFALNAKNKDILEIFCDGVESINIILGYDGNKQFCLSIVIDSALVGIISESKSRSKAEMQQIYLCFKEAIAFKKTINFKKGYVGWGKEVEGTK